MKYVEEAAWETAKDEDMKYIKEIICNTAKEEKRVLEELEKQGYKWNSEEAPTKFCSFPFNFYKTYALQLWRDKTITHGPVLGIGKNAVTAKEFLGKDECIVIYRNGSETIAFNKVTKEKAVAKCSPSDTYDFMTGAKLALERLTGKEEKSEFKPHLSLCGKSCGIIGENTPFKDVIGRNLRVGDTVELYDENNKYFGEYAVACEEDAFVVGIKCCCRKDGAVVDGWKLILKRKHEEISNGEIVNQVSYVKEEKTRKIKCS